MTKFSICQSTRFNAKGNPRILKILKQNWNNERIYRINKNENFTHKKAFIS